MKPFATILMGLVLAFSFAVPATAQDLGWDTTFGGSSDDIATDVQQTTDGGYIIVGYTGNTYSANAWLVKTDAYGNGSLEHLGSSRFALSVQQTNDDGYIIAGQTTVSGGPDDAWLMKIDADRNIEWEKTFGGASMDRASSARQTEDGGYIVAGWTNSYGAGQDDGWLIKTDENGTMEWDKTIGGVNEDEFYEVQQTPDGGYIIVGVTKSYVAGRNWDAWLIRPTLRATSYGIRPSVGRSMIGPRACSKLPTVDISLPDGIPRMGRDPGMLG